jgi:hypothetical protein
MEIVFWDRTGRVIDRRLISPAAGFVEVPGPAHRLTLTPGAGGQPQVWLLSVDGAREECAWDSGDWPVCDQPVRVQVIAENDGRVLTRTFCGDHGQVWVEGLTAQPTVHDLREVADIPEVPSRVRAIPPGAVGYGTVLILDGLAYRVVKYIHKTDGSLSVRAHEQFTGGGEGPAEWHHLGRRARLFIPTND